MLTIGRRSCDDARTSVRVEVGRPPPGTVRPVRRPVPLLLALAALALAACGDEDEPTAKAKEKPKDVPVEFRLASPADAAGERAKALVEEDSLAAEITAGLSDAFVLPRDITVRFVSGEDGPAYDPEDREVLMPYEFVTDTRAAYREAEVFAEEDLDAAVGATVDFVLMHELGHALVDQLDLPITGREEDAVDQLATVLSTEILEEDDIAYAGATLFEVWAADTTVFEDEDFFDEHALDDQRFYAITCLLYGSDTEAYRQDALDTGMTPERLSLCPAEYRQARDSWFTLLEPYLAE